MDNLINTIFPPNCMFCKKTGPTVICDTCLKTCQTLKAQYCIVCDKKSPFGLTHSKCLTTISPIQSISVFYYEGKVRQCVKNSKYGSKEFMALKEMTVKAVTGLQKYPELFKDHIVIPIPISQKKYDSRGFNQAEIISKILAKGLGLSVFPDILVRKKETKAQYNYTRKERFENVSDAFEIVSTKKAHIKGKSILLVDDICTTGATLLEATKVLLLCGASQVRCFTLSKKVIEPD